MYSAATINNAFEQDLNGLIGSFDSTAVVLLLCAFLASSLGVPATSFGFFYFDCCKYAFPD